MLLAANDNFTAAPNTVADTRDLIRQLQQIEWNSSVRPPNDPNTGRPVSRAYVPLFVATMQDGDGAPGDQILSGLTPQPSAMALGATWSPDLARQVGDRSQAMSWPAWASTCTLDRRWMFLRIQIRCRRMIPGLASLAAIRSG